MATRSDPRDVSRLWLDSEAGQPGWLETIAQIYDAYTIYHQSPGQEQAVFDGASGASEPRSERLLRRLLTECALPANGRLLDIGCGNGVLLRTFSGIAPTWTLAGADLDDRHRATVEQIPGVVRFYAGPAEQIPDQFDVITMQHVLEHVPEPVDLLGKLSERLNPGAVLFIQIPNILDNPFDLMVVDHSSHFAPDTVRSAVERVGLRPVVLATDWAPRNSPSSQPPPRDRLARRLARERLALLSSSWMGVSAGWPRQRWMRRWQRAAARSACWERRSPRRGWRTCWMARCSSSRTRT